MKRKLLFKLLFASLTVLWLACGQALACACCANEGDYYKGSSKIRDYELDLMKQMQFGDKASLFLTEADLEEDARGIADPKENYALTSSMVSRVWQLMFRDGVRSGMLSLPVPLTMEMFKADIHDGRQSAGGGPLLYKEWRLEGRLTGSGLFRSGIVGPTNFLLVFQGRGNACDNAEDFTNWRLEVKGTKAKFAFYGEMAKPA